MMLHATSLASLVTLVDLTGAARDVYSRTHLPFEAYITAGPHLPWFDTNPSCTSSARRNALVESTGRAARH